MPFASQALNDLEPDEKKRIRVIETFNKTGWRWMIYWRAGFQTHLKIYNVTWFFAVWLCIRVCAKVLALFGVGDGSFGCKITMREFILVRQCRLAGILLRLALTVKRKRS
jgi:hypothetical protein